MSNNKDFDMKEHILKCAEELFLEKGFALVSTTDIAKHAGCNQALIHYYFRTKENLFQQVYKEKFTKFLYVFSTLEEGDADFFTKLKLKIEAHFDLLVNNPKLPFFVINEMILNEERRRSLISNLYNTNLDIFRRFDNELKLEIKKGNIREINTLDLLLNIISMNIIAFFTLPILTSQFDYSEEEIAEILEKRKKEVVTTILLSLKPQNK